MCKRQTVGGQALWDRYDNGDNLLFKQKDFEAPQDSALLRELWRSPDALTKCLAGHLIRSTGLPVGQEPFWPDLVGSNPPPALSAADERAVQAVLNRPGTRPATTPPPVRPPIQTGATAPAGIEPASIASSRPIAVAPPTVQPAHPAPPKFVVPSPKLGDTLEITLPGGEKLKQVWCPPGTFRIETPGARGKKSPKEVTLTKGFWLGQTVVTQAMWTAVMGTASQPWSGKTHVKGGPNFPASYISHGVNPDGTVEADSATAFCVNLTQIERQAGRLPTGWKYTLPTEAQWEYACRAGTKTNYSFGDDESQLSEYAWFDKNAYDVGEKYAHAVGTKKPNPWGLYDMHGNVWEWCRDGYADKLVGGSDPVNTSAVDRRVLRGGSWRNVDGFTRSAFRFMYTPGVRNSYAGFRVSRTQ